MKVWVSKQALRWSGSVECCSDWAKENTPTCFIKVVRGNINPMVIHPQCYLYTSRLTKDYSRACSFLAWVYLLPFFAYFGILLQVSGSFKSILAWHCCNFVFKWLICYLFNWLFSTWKAGIMISCIVSMHGFKRHWLKRIKSTIINWLLIDYKLITVCYD